MYDLRIAALLTLVGLLGACSGVPKDPGAPVGVPAMHGGAYLEVTLSVDPEKRAEAAKVYERYKMPFLETIDGAVSKELLLRDEDVQVLHGFKTKAQARAYLSSALFQEDVVVGLKPHLSKGPRIRVYERLPVEVPSTHTSGAYLQITLKVRAQDRARAADVYRKYRASFLTKIKGAESKDLIMREDDVQVLHGFGSVEAARAYLNSALFQEDVVVELKPYLQAEPEVHVYESVGG